MVDRLVLENFRNHLKRDFNFSPLTVLIGENGVGKTSILEAIYMLSLTTSWKTKRDEEVVNWEREYTRVISGEREYVIQKKPYLKRYKIDGIGKKVAEVVGSYPAVLFQPDDNLIIQGSPSHRRGYLDRVLIQTSKSYVDAITRLNPVLKQRNRLLKLIKEGKAGREQLSFWNEQLADIHLRIQPVREEYISFLEKCATKTFYSLAGFSNLVFNYHKSPNNTLISKNDFLEHLVNNCYKEIINGVSLYGPHREDLVITINSRVVSSVMSRGQIRSLILAIKMAELEYLQQKVEISPILLLDDVFSELDNTRQAGVFSLFGKNQTVITTVDLPKDALAFIEKRNSSDFSCIELRRS